VADIGGGVMKRLFLFVLVVMLLAALPLCASADEKGKRLVDNGDLLSESEENAVLARLDSLSEKYDYDIVVYTVESLGKKPARFYAAEAFHYGKYGMGEDGESGVILLVSISDREWYIEFFGERRLTEGTAL
jgi:uncharacterized protein